MRRTLGIAALACAATAAGISGTARLAHASDHQDSPAVVADPSADINDVYAWVEGNNVILAMTVTPNAQPTGTDGSSASSFSDAVQYVFHTTSQTGFGTGTPVAENIIATFDASENIKLWVGTDDYVTGSARVSTGISSADGKVKVFAGLIGDPFFFNLDGFKNAVATVEGAGSLTFDNAGCPQLDDPTAAVLRGQLTSQLDGGPAVDNFATFDALAIVVQVDKSLLTKGGPVVAEWASTNQAQ